MNAVSSLFLLDTPQTAKPIYLAPADEFNTWLAATLPELEGLAAANNFKGQKGKLLIAERVVMIGTGDGSDPLILGAASAKLPSGDYYIANPVKGAAAHLACVSWGLGAYRFTMYKDQPDAPRLSLPKGVDNDAVMRETAATALVRNMVNTPAEDMGPGELEAAVRDLAHEYKAKVNVTVGDALLGENFPLIHTVGRAAEKSPRLIEMTWGDKAAPKVTLVGKGVCYDTGGLNIKPGAYMGLMKKDMGGAANVLGLASMMMSSNMDVRLRVLIPAVENAISGNAYRPGDVFPSRKGLTVEIGNTDAEGRLVLADALTYAGEDDPDMIISMATLTGAARVAVGPELAPIYATDDAFAEAVAHAGTSVADPTWRLPFWAGYDENLSSSIADLNHISGDSFAGSIVAALFLKRFVPANISYTHFDIYAWNPKERPGHPKGGEAQAIRALFHALRGKYGS